MIDVHILTLPFENKQWLVECIESMRDDPINLHIVEGIDGDITTSRQQAYLLGQSPFVCRVDSDDLVLKGLFSSAIEVLQNQPEVAATFCHEYITDEFLNIDLKKIGRKPHHGVVYRRSILEKYLNNIPKGYLYPDGFLINHVQLNHKVIEIQEPYYVWRRHKDSFIKRLAKQGLR